MTPKNPLENLDFLLIFYFCDMDGLKERSYEFDGYRIEAEERLLRRGETVIALQPKVIDLLLVLLENHGRVVFKEDLLARVWENQFVEEANLSHTVFQLRKALGGKNEKFIETVPKRGYRFVADVCETPDDETEILVGEQTVTRISVEEEIETAPKPGFSFIESVPEIGENKPQNSAPKTESRQINRKLLALSAAILLIAITGFGYWIFSNRPANTRQIESVAVMPFINESGNAEVEYLADGMTETLISKLSQLPNISVKARSSVFRYKGKDVNLKTIGDELAVQAVLNGRFVQRGDELTLYLSLIDTKTENQLWGKQYNRKLTALITLQTEIAQDVSNSLKTKLSGADEQKLKKTYTENAEAYRFYLKGRFYWNKFTKEGLEKSIEHFEQAIAVDNNFALAYSGLSDTYNVLGINAYWAPKEALPKGKIAAEKAVALDDQLAEAHSALGAVKFLYEWDLAGAERELKRAIELNPDFIISHELYCYLLRAQGRFDEAVREAQKAHELDPLSLLSIGDISETLRFAGRTAEAIEVQIKVIEMDPNFADGHFILGLIYAQHGMHEKAIEEINRAIALSETATRLKAALGQVYAAAGKKAEAYKVLEQLQATARTHYVSPLDVAMIYAFLGENDKALLWLEKAYDDHCGWLIELNVDPVWNNLRADPRFRDLMRRVGLLR
jgi:DNA-binding winged helix-turn-helix (wHTH) protein/TolB-like protein/Tfp pilus assembly protein PilF